MEKTFVNDYLTFEQDKAKSTFLYTWKPTSGNLSNEEFLVEARRITDGILKSECDYIIANDTDFLMSITPALQEIISNQMLQLFNGKIKKFVHITSKEFMAALSIEQLFEENESATYEDIFVDSLEEGLKMAS